jgi:hypothetical protein
MGNDRPGRDNATGARDRDIKHATSGVDHIAHDAERPVLRAPRIAANRIPAVKR